jgi:hydrogenase/urease accessory protein HupE
MKCLSRLAVLVAVLACAQPAASHPVPFSFVDVQLRPDAIELTLVAHIYDIAHDLGITPIERLLEAPVVTEREEAIRALLASRLELAADGQILPGMWSKPDILADRQSIRFNIRYDVDAKPAMVTVKTLMFPYDPVHQTFLNVYEDDDLTSQLILNSDTVVAEYFAGTRQGVWAVVQRFVPSGIEHILIGPDHLLFLVGLMLLGGSMRQLLLVVTSFTIAHSVTLSLAVLNILSPPPNIIEPAIALSIVYVGADNLLAQGGRDMRAWIALAFGFIHGFGFANVLREMQLPSQALGWSLFSFNLGVEIGQVFVVAAVASALSLLRSRNERAWRQLAFAGSLAVIAAGAFWFVQRVFFPEVG